MSIAVIVDSRANVNYGFAYQARLAHFSFGRNALTWLFFTLIEFIVHLLLSLGLLLVWVKIM